MSCRALATQCCTSYGAKERQKPLRQLARTPFFTPFSAAGARSCARVEQGLERGVLQVLAAGFGSAAPARKKKVVKKSKVKRTAEQAPEWKTNSKVCPCGSKAMYDECCGAFHKGKASAPTAEALMRSQFSAYVKKELDYIVNTTHEDHAVGSFEGDVQVSTFKEDVRATADTLDYYKLKILAKSGGGENDTEGTVDFQFWFKRLGEPGQRQKGTKMETSTVRSRFVRGDDQGWLHIDTQDSPVATRQ